MKFETREDAVRTWVEGFNAFPLDMLLKATDGGEDLYEITPYTEEEQEENEGFGQDIFPMWSTMWQFSDSWDADWAESETGLKALKECGFRIYRSMEWGDFIGIDGCGYSFFAEHWTPLYIARGLRWSEED